jgi:hypothetical protein
VFVVLLLPSAEVEVDEEAFEVAVVVVVVVVDSRTTDPF